MLIIKAMTMPLVAPKNSASTISPADVVILSQQYNNREELKQAIVMRLNWPRCWATIPPNTLPRKEPALSKANR